MPDPPEPPRPSRGAAHAQDARASEAELWESGGHYRPSDHPVVELFARQRVAHLEAIGALDGVRTLLDVGAGSGFSSRYYPPAVRVVACDYARGMLRRNAHRDRLRCRATALPFADRSFDAVACWELLHHLDAPVEALREMARVARHRLVLFEPNRLNPGHLVLAATRASERASARFSPRHLRDLLGRAGLEPTRHERCGLFFPNVTPLWAARALAALPFRLPLLGVSQLAIAELRGRRR